MFSDLRWVVGPMETGRLAYHKIIGTLGAQKTVLYIFLGGIKARNVQAILYRGFRLYARYRDSDH